MGKPILVHEIKEKPTQKEIDDLHEVLLTKIVELFDDLACANTVVGESCHASVSSTRLHILSINSKFDMQMILAHNYAVLFRSTEPLQVSIFSLNTMRTRDW